MSGEGGEADDRVVAPVVAVLAAPGRKPRRDDRPVEARGELLHAREQGVAVKMSGKDWMMPARGSASMARVSVRMQSPVMRLSASSTII